MKYFNFQEMEKAAPSQPVLIDENEEDIDGGIINRCGISCAVTCYVTCAVTGDS